MRVEVLDRRKQDRQVPLSHIGQGEFFFRDGSEYPHQVLLHGIHDYLGTSYTTVLVWNAGKESVHACSLRATDQVTPINTIKLVIR